MVGQDTTNEFWDYVMQTVRDLADKSYYDLLGIDREATGERVSEAYYMLLRRLHPDAHGAERNRVRQRALTRLSARLGEAYRTLSDPKRREEYDRGLSAGRRRLLKGEDAGPSAGPQDPSSESARKLWEQGLEHLDKGELTRARAQLVLAKSFEPQSKAIVSAWDRLLEEEHDKLNQKRVARGFQAQPYESLIKPDAGIDVEEDIVPGYDPDDDSVDDDFADPANDGHFADAAATNPPRFPGMLDAGIAGPGAGVPGPPEQLSPDDAANLPRNDPRDPYRGPTREDTIRRAVLDLSQQPAQEQPDILRGNAIVPEPDAHVYESPQTIREIDPPIDATIDATIDEALDGNDEDIAVEIAADDDDMVDADTMFEPADDDPDESTQQVSLEDMVSPPLRVRVRTWDQAAKLYVLIRDRKGLYIRSGKDAHIAQRVDVEVVLPTEEAIMIGAIVRDVVLPGDPSGRSPGLGVEFTGIDDRNRAQVERLNPPLNQS